MRMQWQPTRSQNRWSSSSMSSCTCSSLVRMHVASRKSSPEACSMPCFSEPAMGWEPINATPVSVRAEPTDWWTQPFTEPTSVTSTPGFSRGSIPETRRDITPTGVASTTRSAPSTTSSNRVEAAWAAPEERAYSSGSSLLPHRRTWTCGSCFLTASAREPPRRPGPRMATEEKESCFLEASLMVSQGVEYTSAPEHTACSGARASSFRGGRIRARGTS